MHSKPVITPKQRINSIDALRGFALIGIMLLHCMERFDLTYVPSGIAFLASSRYVCFRLDVVFICREVVCDLLASLRSEFLYADGLAGSQRI